MKKILLNLCGISFKFFEVVSPPKTEVRHYFIYCISFVFSLMLNFLGTAVLIIETTESKWLTFIGASLWTFIYFVIFRLALTVTLNNRKFTFGRFLNIIFVSCLLILLSSFSFSGTFFLFHSLLGDVEHENIYSLVEIVNVVKEDLSSGNGLVIFLGAVLPIIILFPFLFVSLSKRVRNGKYMEKAVNQRVEVVTANYERFKKMYHNQLLESLSKNKGFTSEYMKSLNLEFYEGFEDPPFNSTPKKEW